ncbi:hypothetical protein GALL_436200 [mine drainage metagenome]|uniref:Uncharacterized protein n=1 Tax=mine drainage metagenome TaxID=410659 RepID=A0A1J5Q420_9ZZZZ
MTRPMVMYSQVSTMRRGVLSRRISVQAMMQAISTSQVASTHRCTSHHHQYMSLAMLVSLGKASR